MCRAPSQRGLWSARLPACPPARLPAWLRVCLPTHPPVWLAACVSVCLLACLPACLPACLSACVSTAGSPDRCGNAFCLKNAIVCYSTPNICQDRLGTNIQETLNTETRFLQAPTSALPTALPVSPQETGLPSSARASQAGRFQATFSPTGTRKRTASRVC